MKIEINCNIYISYRCMYIHTYLCMHVCNPCGDVCHTHSDDDDGPNINKLREKLLSLWHWRAFFTAPTATATATEAAAAKAEALPSDDVADASNYRGRAAVVVILLQLLVPHFASLILTFTLYDTQRYTHTRSFSFIIFTMGVFPWATVLMASSTCNY